MKKIFRALTLCLVLLSLLCAAVPAAFAAGNKEDTFYTIGLDACGGVSSTVVVTTNLDGKLTTLPESPTMDGYTFNGWYTEPVGGSRVTTKSYQFDLVKVDGTTNKLLDGAEFKLYTAKDGGEPIKFVAVEGGYRVANGDETGAVDTIKVNGKVHISGLDKVNYWLDETHAPAGYNKLTERQEVKLSEGSQNATLETGAITWAEGNGGVVVKNNAGTVLPSTGGMGTTLFYVIGGGLMVAAVVLLVTKKRMEHKN